MPPKTPHDRGDGEQTEKRSRKAVDRLSSSKLTAKQYSPLGLLLVDKADSAVERSHQVCLDTSPHAQVCCSQFCLARGFDKNPLFHLNSRCDACR